ncbi:MAG TPA: M1 family metallopeptidase [Flavihumibacter sp.]|nr:M1 family metallopeptidase [Flavihumibacter sp.]
MRLLASLLTTTFFSVLTLVLSAQDMKSGGVLKPEQANMDVRHYTLSLAIRPDSQSIEGFTDIDCILKEAAPLLILDLTHLLQVQKIEVNGRKADFRHAQDLIYIPAAKTWPAGKTRIRVYYGGKSFIAPRAPWTGGFQWEKDSTGHPWIAVTCQSEGAKIFFPCKDHPSDEPNEGADMIITVPRGLVVAGPGLLVSTKHKGNTSTYHWRTRYTISNYCIIPNVGNYSKVTRLYTSVDGNKIPMEFYVLKDHADKAPYQLQLLERSCQILEKYFGEYPWAKEKIGLVETPHLGMEHQSMIAYGNKFRYVKVGNEDYDWLMTHEFGHEWWANKVSNKDWAHMWIQEGICSYADALFTREAGGEEAYQARMRNTMRHLSGKPVIWSDTADSDLAYTGDIYGKGAFFMHSLRHYIGDSIFFPTLKKLATDPAYTYDNMVDTYDVLKLFNKESKRDLTAFFDFYLRTTNKFDILVKSVADGKYQVSVTNFDQALPVEISTDKGLEKWTLSKTPVVISSQQLPAVDPIGFYLKTVRYE